MGSSPQPNVDNIQKCHVTRSDDYEWYAWYGSVLLGRYATEHSAWAHLDAATHDSRSRALKEIEKARETVTWCINQHEAIYEGLQRTRPALDPLLPEHPANG